MGNPWTLDEVSHRKIAFTWHMLSCGHSWGVVPRVVTVPHLSAHFRITWLRFLAANAIMVPARHYKVIHSHPEYKDRLCTRCALRNVADEHHIFLVCPSTAGVRARFSPLLRMQRNLQSLVYNNRSAWKHLAEFVAVALASYGWAPPV